MERRREIVTQTLKIEHVQHCYREAPFDEAELVSSVARKCAKIQRMEREESKPTKGAARDKSSSSSVEQSDKEGKNSKKKSIHARAKDDAERWATKTDQCLKAVHQLRFKCKSHLACCPYVKE